MVKEKGEKVAGAVGCIWLHRGGWNQLRSKRGAKRQTSMGKRGGYCGREFRKHSIAD